MTKLQDTSHIFKTYALGHKAAHDDIVIIDQYLKASPQVRQAKREQFRDWLGILAKLRRIEWIGSDEFFFPRFQKYIEQGEEFVENMRKRQQTMNDIEGEVDLMLARPDFDDALLVQRLHTYSETLNDYLTHHETILLPVILAQYDPNEHRQVEKAFRKRVGVSSISLFLPWMLTRASAQEKQELLKTVPFPVRWLYTHVWEPSFLKRVPKVDL